jgi:hypothetical protein
MLGSARAPSLISACPFARAQSDHTRPVGVVEMTADRIAQRFEIIGLGEDRMAKSARDEAAFRRSLDRENVLTGPRTHATTITARHGMRQLHAHFGNNTSSTSRVGLGRRSPGRRTSQRSWGGLELDDLNGLRGNGKDPGRASKIADREKAQHDQRREARSDQRQASLDAVADRRAVPAQQPGYHKEAHAAGSGSRPG